MLYIISKPNSTNKRAEKATTTIIAKIHKRTMSRVVTNPSIYIKIAILSFFTNVPSPAIAEISTNPSLYLSTKPSINASSEQQWQEMLNELNETPIDNDQNTKTDKILDSNSALNPIDTKNITTQTVATQTIETDGNESQTPSKPKNNQISSYQMPSVQDIEHNISDTFNTNIPIVVPVAKLDGSTTPIGFDKQFFNQQLPNTTQQKVDLENAQKQAVLSDLTTNKVSPVNVFHNEITDSINQSISTPMRENINPDDYLPAYINKKVDEVNTGGTPDDSHQTNGEEDNQDLGLLKRTYNKIVHNSLPPLPKIDVEIYQRHKNYSGTDNGVNTLINVDTKTQPMKNIKSALEDIYVDTLMDFQAGLPSIKKTAKEAAEAVGYYDTDLTFQLKNPDIPDQLTVIIESVGEPVVVESRVVDIRGAGENLEEFQQMKDTLPPLEGAIFNQGHYESSKYAINQQTNRLGFFDNKWLDNSADVLLPDNTVDISLILDTGNRYQFGDVVFFTADPNTGQLTKDPEKLPVKPEILKKLLGFKTGEPYVLDKIDQLKLGLSATQYFNISTVEQVMPTTADGKELKFKNIVDENLNNDSDDSHTEATDTDRNIHNNKDNNIKDDIQKSQEKETLSPIDFSVDDSVTAKYKDVEKKAKQLLKMPNNRVLNEKNLKSRTVIGKLSDGISTVAKSILPDETSPLLPKLNKTKESILSNKITSETVKETKEVPLYVFVVSSKPYDAKFGFGYGTDTGFRTTATLENHLVNRDGYQAGVSGEWTDINNKIDVHASRPWQHPINDTLSSGLSYEETVINQGNDGNNWSTKTFQAGIGRNRINKNGWNRSYSARYRYDELDIGNDVQARADELPIKFHSSNPVQKAMLFGYSMDKTTANDLANPTQGYRQYYSAEVGAENLLTDTNMAIARVGASGIYSFGKDKQHQVIGKANTSYLWADDFENVPYTLRFFAGGDQSIRGYDYNSLSPLNDSGYLTGGQILAVGSGEYNYEFKEGLRGAVFADIGNSYDSDFNNQTKLGLGIGIRWASPVGSVRLDVAAGVSEDEHIPIRLHFFIGSPL